MANRGTFTFPGKSRSQPFDSPVVTSALFSQRPPAGFPGRQFYATDNAIMYLDDGLSWQALNPRMVAHSEAQTTAVNTAAETALFIATIPAGTLAVGDALRITSYGDMLNNSGGTKSVTFRLYQNASLPLDTGSFGSIAGSANRGSWRLDFLLSATSLTTQRGNAMIEVFSGNANTWKSSITSTANAISRANGTYTGGAENLANSMTVQLNVVMSAADPNYDFRCQGYNIEKLTA